VKYRAVENEFEFENGSVIHLCYCDAEQDVENYQGAEIHVLMPDELTHYTDYQYRYLRAQVRISGCEIPEKYRGMLPRIESGSNPGSVGHAWVRRSFIAPVPSLEVWRAPKDEGGMLRQFIPAKLTDNPHLTKDDPEYADRLHGMGSDNLVRAMLEGDWDIIAGAAFEKLRRESTASSPSTRRRSGRYSAHSTGARLARSPSACGASRTAIRCPMAASYRRGAIIRYNEVYGWKGKSNEGTREGSGGGGDAHQDALRRRRSPTSPPTHRSGRWTAARRTRSACSLRASCCANPTTRASRAISKCASASPATTKARCSTRRRIATTVSGERCRTS
jgi:hypothetical protein